MSDLGIKYTDKSAGQPELVLVFEAIKKLMIPYAKGSLKLKGGDGGQVALISDKPVVIEGRKKEEVWFAGALVQKGYVGFYFMPIYMNEPLRKKLSPELMKTLKGKSCFYIKKADPQLLGQIKEALQLGHAFFKEMGWI